MASGREAGAPGTPGEKSAHGILDELKMTVTPDGRTYFHSQRCPACSGQIKAEPPAQQPLISTDSTPCLGILTRPIPDNVVLLRRRHV